MGLQIVFWNVGLAPPRGKPQRSPQSTASALTSLFEYGIDLVALCEVGAESLEALARELPIDCNVVAIVDDVGRSRWDLAVVAPSINGLSLDLGVPVVARDGGTTIRAGHSLTIRDRAGVEFVLFLSHWPSRLRGNAPLKRKRASEALSVAVLEHLQANDPVVVMGDFNEEPFDAPIQEGLRASRDPAFTLRAPEQRLYNPCWWLSCPPVREPWNPFGSCRYPEGDTSTRYLLTSALVSAHFLSAEACIAPVARVHVASAPDLATSTMNHQPLELVLYE